MPQNESAFLEVGDLVDGELYLMLVDIVPADLEKGHAPAYSFDMTVQNVDKQISDTSISE